MVQPFSRQKELNLIDDVVYPTARGCGGRPPSRSSSAPCAVRWTFPIPPIPPVALLYRQGPSGRSVGRAAVWPGAARRLCRRCSPPSGWPDGPGRRSGTIQSGYQPPRTTRNAFVSDPARIRDNTNVELPRRLGHAAPRRPRPPRRTSSSRRPVAQVRPTGRIVVRGDHRLSVRRSRDTNPIAGRTTPAAPADQSVWVARACGTPAVVEPRDIATANTASW